MGDYTIREKVAEMKTLIEAIVDEIKDINTNLVTTNTRLEENATELADIALAIREHLPEGGG